MKINLEGGYVEIIGTWKNVLGQEFPLYRAFSNHTNTSLECQSRGLAEFFVWIVNEKYASMMMRGAI
jgi:glycerol-3-phosphate dehydrogenase